MLTRKRCLMRKRLSCWGYRSLFGLRELALAYAKFLGEFLLTQIEPPKFPDPPSKGSKIAVSQPYSFAFCP